MEPKELQASGPIESESSSHAQAALAVGSEHGSFWGSGRSNFFLGSVVLAVATFVGYGPALNGDFILDDDLLLTKNAIIKDNRGLWQFWLTQRSIEYHPITNSSLWLEWRLWGMNPLGYHITNLLIHICSCLLLWAILRKLSVPGAYLAALLFALHPVNVESAAWIAQRKDVLAVFFCDVVNMVVFEGQ